MNKRTKEVDDALRKKLAKLRFKRVVRVAYANHQWVNETDDQGITLNVKKNVAMLVRKKHKTGILTMAQKGLLATLHSTRSIAERKKLCTIVASLGCFTQVPPKIRARLVPYLHFMVVSAGRTLMKEGDMPTCVYFVVSGEVEMSRKLMNKISRKVESKPEAFFGPGDWIGEVELLEENSRMNTYKATTNCEILALDDFDFRAMLMPYVKKVWIEKKRAIASLSYLRYMNDSQIVSACKFGILRQYDPLSTIYPDSSDNIQHVYFVLSGECVLLQCLYMRVRFEKGELHYDLSPVAEDASENEVEDDKTEPFDVRELLRSSSSLDEAGKNKKKAKRKAEFAKIEANCKLLNEKPTAVEERPMMRQFRHSHHHKSIMDHLWDDDFDFSVCEDEEDLCSTDSDYSLKRDSNVADGMRRSSRLSKSSKQSRQSRQSKQSRNSKDMSEESVEEEELAIITASPSRTSTPTSSSYQSKWDKGEGNYVTHFVDVGSMTFGGLFGVGEKGDHRVVMARTTVQCLLIPRYWLMEEDQNPGHMWQRMRFYLDRWIPSRKTLYEDFIKTRKWAQFKADCVEEFTNSITSDTKVEDIPIVIRIVELKEPKTGSTTR
ncbi:PREDICTED: uncharacterized protein LOC108618419 isoform X1 [Drosophila arizonae]|uniref:Uncharacterized protein LOC108618419 isoform X1 n=1 Tax=Drosophila arizonae TaxID=7263 RepID=A0ABM1PRR9_DROAR|nr:PREDICTED: uncharacterized protein LOC108618419 isoform X1 [Drosophila arizonae]